MRRSHHQQQVWDLLPIAIIQQITTYLSAEDAVRFSTGSRVTNMFSPLVETPIFDQLHYSGDPPRNEYYMEKQERSVRRRIDHHGTTDLLFNTNISIAPVDQRTHSTSLSFRWCDQGWGNRKGRVWLVGFAADRKDNGRSQVTRERIVNDPSEFVNELGGQVVWTSTEVAPHEFENVTMTFRPRKSHVYELWARVGGGGGHRLRIVNGRLRTLMFAKDE